MENSTLSRPIGVAFTTFNRTEQIRESLSALRRFPAPDMRVVVVDDGSWKFEAGSRPPVFDLPNQYPELRLTVVRHDQSKGIPAAKNRCLEELMKLGVEHLFLFDDDTRPDAPEWWKPYVEGSEPHYQYSWLSFANDGRAVPKMAEFYRDQKLVGLTWSMGCLLYVTRDVVNRVGGYNLAFSPGFEEHAEYSQRIHNAGLTTFVHQDHPGMRETQFLVHASDEWCGVQRSFRRDEIQTLVERNEQIRLDLVESDKYVEYRDPKDVVLTTYLTSHMDPQRQVYWPADGSAISDLIRSVHSNGQRIVLLHDIGEACPTGVEFDLVDPVMTAYEQRWIAQYQWLRDHPEINRVWLVDATDVKLLQPDPYSVIEPGKLYCGYESKVIGIDWIMERHCPPSLGEWLRDNSDRMLLNCGVVGGDRVTVMQLCRRMIDLWVENDQADPLYEMAFFQKAAYDYFEVVTGPRIVSVFKRQEHPTWSVWKHK